MSYRLLADVVVAVHLLLIVCGLLGGLLYYWRKWLIFVHLPLALWISLIEFFDWTCPLTPLEKSLRAAGGEAGYAGGFVEHYLLPVIYPPGLTPDVQIVLGVVAASVNGLVYIAVARSYFKRRQSVKGSLAIRRDRT